MPSEVALHSDKVCHFSNYIHHLCFRVQKCQFFSQALTAAAALIIRHFYHHPFRAYYGEDEEACTQNCPI